jgi:regulator of sigma E protease
VQILSNILAFLFAAGIIIFVHELGHYLAAKIFGVRVLVFSLGFGKRIWGFRRGDTDYRVSFIPLGGYVSFFGQDPSERTDDPAAFLNQPRWQRVLILLAGPAMNVVLAVMLVAAVYMVGTDLPNQREVSTEIGVVIPGGPADQAGLQTGDRIVALDGQPMSDWQATSMVFLTSPDRPIQVEFERGGERLSTVLKPAIIPRYELGDPGLYSAAPPRVREVLEDSPAARAGLRYGDALLAVNGRPLATMEEFQQAIRPLAGQEARIEVDRDGERLELVAVPELREGNGAIGIVIAEFHFQRFPPVEALRRSVRYNWDTTLETFAFLGKIFERRISAQSALGGPIEIARISGAAARTGFKELIFFMALISLNLFILNMMPVPILDGGQILILLVESTLRRDLSLGFKERMTQVGLVLIVLLMAMALYFDLLKSLPVSSE